MKVQRRSKDIGLVFVGAIFLVASVICLSTSLVGKSESRRWQAAPSIQEPGDLQAVGEGGDVVIVGPIAPDAPVAEEGLALYERWEHEVEYEDGERESHWRHNYDYDHKPTFDLLFGEREQRMRVRSGFVIFYNPREVMVKEHVKLKGFAPDDVVTVMGNVQSSADPLAVQAEIICGGERERCMKRLSRSSVGPAIGAALMLLIGGGLMWLGLKKHKAPADS
jgi:hypothetical protein